MARIPDSELESLKRDISLVRLAEARGIVLRGHGDNLLGLCPFHDDKEPSFVVSPSKNIWHCLGACKTGGSVVDFVMKSERVSFRLAVEMLRKESPALVASGAGPTSIPKTKPRLEALAVPDEPDAVVLGRVVDHYHAALKESPEALAYLEARGLTHPELVSHFTLGFANRTLGYRLPQRQVNAGEALRAQLIRLGVYRTSGHEHLNGSITIPVFGSEGEVLEMYGRKIRDTKLPPGTPKHLYLPARADGRRGVFNLPAFTEAKRTGKELILCEALLDALTFWCAGFRNVSSAYGTQGFTSELRAAIHEHGIERVILAYDRDDAGDRAAEVLAKDLGRAGLEVFRVLFPKGMDANAYALKVKPAAKSLETALLAATWMAGTRPLAVPDDVIAAEPEVPHDPVTGEILDAPSSSTPLVASSETSEEAGLEEVRREEVRFCFGPRRWRVRGLAQNTSHASLRVNLLVAQGERFFVDTLELYSARHRAAFLKEAAVELDLEERILKSDLGKVVLRLEDLVHAALEAEVDNKEAVVLSPEEHEAAMKLLKDPDLFSRILEAFETSGVVGEETNKLVSYLAAVSRKLDAPLAVVFQSSSAAGKSSLMDAALRFVPDEERVHYSAMTGQSLFYMGEQDLAHKVLAISEEEGAHSASYALKLLQSEGQLTIASTGKDPASGRLRTHEYKVEGPVMIFLTTTAIEVDEELLNRCLVLTVDESKQQTSAIHAQQREGQTLEGLLRKTSRQAVYRLHQNAQRLLEPLFVANPFARSLGFSSQATRSRRDHMKYLTLIRAVALLHQHQRPVQEIEHEGQRIRYIEVLASDIDKADRLAEVVLRQGLDELPPQTRRLLDFLKAWVAEESKKAGIEPDNFRFSRKQVRERTTLGNTQLKMHLHRLEELEHLLVHAGGARRRIVYQLVMPTSEPVAQTQAYDGNWSGSEGLWSGLGRPLVGGGGRPDFPNDSADKTKLVGVSVKTRLPEAEKPAHVARSLVPQNGRAEVR